MTDAHKALEIEPGETISLIVLAECHRTLVENGPALQCWKQYSVKNPKSVIAHLALTDSYVTMDKRDRYDGMMIRLELIWGDRSLTDLIHHNIKTIEALVYMLNTTHVQTILKGSDGTLQIILICKFYNYPPPRCVP